MYIYIKMFKLKKLTYFKFYLPINSYINNEILHAKFSNATIVFSF